MTSGRVCLGSEWSKHGKGVRSETREGIFIILTHCPFEGHDISILGSLGCHFFGRQGTVVKAMDVHVCGVLVRFVFLVF